MKLLQVIGILCGLIIFNPLSFAHDTKSIGTIASPRTIEYSWMSIDEWNKMHAEDVAVAEQGGVDLLFVGDSITAGWDWNIWQKNFAEYKPANFGIGGDHTGNLLWRLQNGDKGKLSPKVVVLLIGVNNFGHLKETPVDVFNGVTAVVNGLRVNYPNAKILINGVFPFNRSAKSPKRAKVKKLNQLITTLDDNKYIFVRNYGHLLLQADGKISKEIMADYLHPTAKGYQIWADAMLPDIQTLMK